MLTLLASMVMAAPPGWDGDLWTSLSDPVGMQSGLQGAGLEARQASLLTGQEGVTAAVVWTTLGGEVLLRAEQTRTSIGQVSCASRSWDSPEVRPTELEHYPVRPGRAGRHDRPELVRVSGAHSEHMLVGLMPGDVLTWVSVMTPDGRRGERVELARADRSLSLVREPGREKLCYSGARKAVGESSAGTRSNVATAR